MSSRTVCASNGDRPRYKYIRETATAAVTKVRRTRKAPDFYSPENASSKSSARIKKVNSDDNDSWKPESETDEANSESESEQSNGKREKTTVRKRSFARKSSPEEEEDDDDDAEEEMEMEERPLTPSQPNDKDEDDEDEDGSDSDVEAKPVKDKKGETAVMQQHKEKKVKGCRELQDLLDGCAQVHKEARSRRLPPRREQNRAAVQTNGQSDSTWSHSSSRAATEKDSGHHHPQLGDKHNAQHSSKQQPSSRNTSVHEAQTKTVDSSVENPVTTQMSETVDDDDDFKPSVSTRRTSQQYGNKGNAAATRTCTRRSKTTTTETFSDSSVRVKRQRLDVDAATQMRKTSKGTENGTTATTTTNTKMSGRDAGKDAASVVIRLPRMPMIRYGDYWYRARIKQEREESVFVEFTGFEDGTIKPFWIRKDSVDVFKGSYSGKDWRHFGDGAWLPKPRKSISRKGKTRKKKLRGASKMTESREQQGSKFSQDFADQAYTGDSEKCSKPAAGMHGSGGSGERVYYRKSNGDPQTPGALEKARSGDSVQGMGDAECTGREAKNLDRGSQSDAHPKDARSEESCPDRTTSNPDNLDDDEDCGGDSHLKRTDGIQSKQQETEQEWMKATSGASPFSRNPNRPSASSQIDEGGHNKEAKKFHAAAVEQSRKDHSSSAGNENSEERCPPRLRRKPGRVSTGRQEEERTTSVRRPKTLRRSARLGPKGSWKFKEDSSSEVDQCEEDVNATRRNSNGRPGMNKYVTRSVRNSEAGHRNGGTGLSAPQALHKTSHIQRSHPTQFPSGVGWKRGRKTVLRSQGSKEEFEGDDYEEVFENGTQPMEDPPSSRGLMGPPQRNEKERRSPVLDNVDGDVVWNLGVNVSSQIRKYLPYYSDHIPDTRLMAFMELMERLDGIGMKQQQQQPVELRGLVEGPSVDGTPASVPTGLPSSSVNPLVAMTVAVSEPMQQQQQQQDVSRERIS